MSSGTPDHDRALQRLLAMAAAADEPAERPELGPRYEIVRELGRGGMGVVYEVDDRQLGRRCALKTLGAGADPELRRRLAREAAAAARLRHPHIAAVFDATPDFITMQLVAGGPIGSAPSLDRRLAVELVRDAALALQHAHDQGIVHRDVKPSNLLVEDRHVFVVDFGLAKSIDAAGAHSWSGVVAGTPSFMAPEQALGQTDRVAAPTDVYGLGATLWYCLHGAPPFQAPDLPSLLRAVVDDDPRPATGDRDLDLVLGKCLAKAPEHRYATARDFAADLDRWLRDEPVLARRPSLWWRWQKRLRRQRLLWRAAALAAFATALVLVPIWLNESASRQSANDAVGVADHAATVLQDATLSMSLGDVGAARQRLYGGIAEVRAFLDRHEVPRVRYLLARLLLAASNPDAALVELDHALRVDPGLADARFERGLLLATRREQTPEERARAIADLSVDLRAGSVLRDVDRLFGRAELARLRGEHARAMELLEEVLEYDGMHVRARMSLAAVARALGNNNLSTYYSASAIDLQQGHAPFYLAQGRRSLPTSILGLHGVLVDYGEALRDRGDSAGSLAHRGLVQLRRAVRLDSEGDSRAAIEAVEAAIADHDNVLLMHQVAGAFVNRAVCRFVLDGLLLRTGDSARAAVVRKDAEADLAMAIAHAPNLPEAHANRGLMALRSADVLRALGRSDAAARVRGDAESAFRLALEHAPPGWRHAAMCRERQAAAR